jgi:hypothetical protein
MVILCRTGANRIVQTSSARSDAGSYRTKSLGFETSGGRANIAQPPPGASTYADIDTSEVFGGADHRIYEGKEFDMDRVRMSNAKCEISWVTKFWARGYFDEEMIRAYISNRK